VDFALILWSLLIVAAAAQGWWWYGTMGNAGQFWSWCALVWRTLRLGHLGSVS